MESRGEAEMGMTPDCKDCVHYMSPEPDVHLCKRFHIGHGEWWRVMRADVARQYPALCGPEGRRFRAKQEVAA